MTALYLHATTRTESAGVYTLTCVCGATRTATHPELLGWACSNEPKRIVNSPDVIRQAADERMRDDPSASRWAK